MSISKSEMKKILIIRYRFIGDTLLTTPIIKNLKEIFPISTIDILVSPNSGEIVEGNPNLNNIYYLDTSKFHKYETKNKNDLESRKLFTSLFSCAAELKKEKYDLIFVLKRSFSSAFLAFLIGGKERIGFNTEFRFPLLTKSIKYEKNTHELDNFLNCLKPISNDIKKHYPEVFPTEEEKTKVKDLLNDLDPYKPKIVIHASSAHPYKMWPNKYFSSLIDLLYMKYKAQFIFTGAEIDKGLYEKIINKAKYREKIKFLNLCGKTTIRECYALYENIHLGVCVDSGNAHLLAAAGVSTYVLFGPTGPDKWLPVGKKVNIIKLEQDLPCQPCEVKRTCTHISCMKLVKPDYVFEQLEKAFSD